MKKLLIGAVILILVSCANNSAEKLLTKEKANEIYSSYTLENARTKYHFGSSKFTSEVVDNLDYHIEDYVANEGDYEQTSSIAPNDFIYYFINSVDHIEQIVSDFKNTSSNYFSKDPNITYKYSLLNDCLTASVKFDGELKLYRDLSKSHDEYVTGHGNIHISETTNEVGLLTKRYVELSYSKDNKKYSLIQQETCVWSADDTVIADNITDNEKYFKNNKVTLYDNKAHDLIYDENTKFAKDEKYFLVFVQENCSACFDAHSGFETLIKDKSFESDYKLKTVYVDEEDDVDVSNEGLFYELFFKQADDVTNFRQAIYDSAMDSDYTKIVNDDDYTNMFEDILEGNDIWMPLILLMDVNTFESDPSTFGIKEAMIGLTGWNNSNSAFAKAETLDRMWNSNWSI